MPSRWRGCSASSCCVHSTRPACPSPPACLPRQWVVDCRNVGRGEPALEYLSRYLYRGVIGERDLVDYDENAGIVTFRYCDSQTHKAAYRRLPIAEFLWRLLLHVLPTGFRRMRDYRFLHGKARARLALVQLVLRVMIQPRASRPRPVVCARTASRRCASSPSTRDADPTADISHAEHARSAAPEHAL